MNIIGHTRTLEQLGSALKSGRLAHAFLFCGPKGVGKFRAAVVFANAYLCGRGEGLRPCGACAACLALARGISRNVHLLDAAARTVSLAPALPVLLASQHARAKSESGTGVPPVKNHGQDAHATSSGTTASGKPFVEMVRDMISELSLKPLEGRRRSVICRDVELMSEEAFNAFLKTLEEPPSATLIVLITSRPDLLPETVVSRCQVVRFGTLADQDVHTVLDTALGRRVLEVRESGHQEIRASGVLDAALGRSAVEEREARNIALAVSLAEGSPGRAMELLGGNALELRTEFLNAVLGGPGNLLDMAAVDALFDRWKRATKDNEAMRKRVTDSAQFLASVLRDWLRVRAASEHEQVATPMQLAPAATAHAVYSPLEKGVRGLSSPRRSGEQEANIPPPSLDKGEWRPPSPSSGGNERSPCAQIVNVDYKVWLDRAATQLDVDSVLTTLDKLLDVEADIGRNLRPDLALDHACCELSWP